MRFVPKNSLLLYINLFWSDFGEAYEGVFLGEGIRLLLENSRATSSSRLEKLSLLSKPCDFFMLNDLELASSLR